MSKNNEESIIEVKDLSKSFGDHEVLRKIDFEVKKGEVICILGSSGSGKSTLMNILGCLDKPTSGKYILEGYDIAAKDDNELAAIRGKTIGFVFQNFNLMMKRTIADNVSLPLIYQKVGEDERYKRALEMLDKVNLAGYQDRPPSQISGGMQQRVAIARALALKPDILCFDEPTSALDPISTSKVEELMDELKKQYTVVIVTHNMQQASRIADYTAFFLVGEMVEYGPTKDVFGMPKDKRTEDYITGRFG